MTASFVLVLIAAILSGLATFRGYAVDRGAGFAGFDLIAAALCLFFVSLLLGGAHG